MLTLDIQVKPLLYSHPKEGFPAIGSSLIIVMLLLFRVEKLMPKIEADLDQRRKIQTADEQCSI